MSLPPLAVAIVWIAVILGMTAGFVVFAHKWRERRMRDSDATASDLLAEFLDLRSRGELSEQEYQRIKARLSLEIQRELAEEGTEPDSSDPTKALKATARRLLADHSAPKDEQAHTGE